MSAASVTPATLAAWLAVLAPAAGALLLGMAPAAGASRWAGRAAAALALAATLALAGAAAPTWTQTGPIWHIDRLAIHIAILVATLHCAAAWTVPKSKSHTARDLAAAAASTAAVLTGTVLATWLGVYLAALAVSRGGWGDERMPTLVGLATALFGTVLLGLAAVPALGTGLEALSWDALARAGRACDGGLLSLAFVIILAGYSAVAMAVPPSGVPAITLHVVLAALLLRLRDVLASNPDAIASATLLAATGLVLLGGSAAGLWASRARSDPRARATLGQVGAALFAFGLGGAGAQAGLLHLTVVALSAAAAATGGGLARKAGVAALAMVPPFGPFASAALIVAAASREAPWLVVLLALGLAALAAAVLRRLPRRSEPAAGRAGRMVPWLALAATVLFGLAMPAGVAAWFAAAAAGLP